jgi:hypothetical protein
MSDWPREIRRERILNNQRPSLAERAKKHVSAQQRREGNSDKHRAIVKHLPCCVCWRTPVDGHHLKTEGAAKERGVGMRATDKWIVPLCRMHHDDLESYGSRREYEWFAAHGIEDPYALAKALWDAPKDITGMAAIVAAHREIKVKI